jgi:hypothetical protein
MKAARTRDLLFLPLPQVAQSIERMTSDDEILSKIALRDPGDHRGHIDAGPLPQRVRGQVAVRGPRAESEGDLRYAGRR